MLELRDLSGGYDSLVIVNDLNLVVPTGSVTALLGPNGAGKTTTLRLLMGLLKPQSGEVWFEGRDITALAPRKRDERNAAERDDRTEDCISMRALSNHVMREHETEER